MLKEVHEIVRNNHGWQLASDNGVFRFHTDGAAKMAASEINNLDKTIKTFITNDILVITLSGDFRDRLSKQDGRIEKRTDQIMGSSFLGTSIRCIPRP